MTTVDVRPWPARPPRRLAGFAAGQLVGGQIALALTLAAIGRPVWLQAGLGAAAAVVVGLIGWRRRERWAYEWLWLRWCFHTRRRRVPAARDEPAELALLGFAAGAYACAELTVDDVAVATVDHAGGLTAVLEIAPAAVATPAPLLPAGYDGPDTSLQLLVHSGYHRRSWLAVRALRGDGHSAAELRAGLTAAVRRLRREAALQARPLDAAQLCDALRALTHLDIATATQAVADQPLGVEAWRAWWTRGLPQQSLRIRSWPTGRPVPLDVLAAPGVPYTISLAVRRGRGGTVSQELAVRLTERSPRALDAAMHQLRARLAAAGLRVDRLDGQEVDGLAATLPLGGFVRRVGLRPAAG